MVRKAKMLQAASHEPRYRASTKLVISSVAPFGGAIAAKARSLPLKTYLYRFLTARTDEQISTLMCASYLRVRAGHYGTIPLLSTHRPRRKYTPWAYLVSLGGIVTELNVCRPLAGLRGLPSAVDGVPVLRRNCLSWKSFGYLLEDTPSLWHLLPQGPCTMLEAAPWNRRGWRSASGSSADTYRS